MEKSRIDAICDEFAFGDIVDGKQTVFVPQKHSVSFRDYLKGKVTFDNPLPQDSIKSNPPMDVMNIKAGRVQIEQLIRQWVEEQVKLNHLKF